MAQHNLPDGMSWNDYMNRDARAPRQGVNTFRKPLTDENRHMANPDDDRPGALEDGEYDGRESMPRLPEQISVIGIKAKSPLKVPYVTSGMDEKQAGRVANQWITGLLERGGEQALSYIRSAHSEATRAQRLGHDLGHDGKFTVVDSHNSTSVQIASLIDAVRETYPIENTKDKQAAIGDIHHEESVARTLQKHASKTEQRSSGAKIPNDPSKVDFSALLEKFQERAPQISSERIHPQFFEKNLKGELRKEDVTFGNKTSKRVTGLKEGSIISPEYEATVVKHVNSIARLTSLPIPASAISGNQKPKTVTATTVVFAEPARKDMAMDRIANASENEELIIGSSGVLKGASSKARISPCDGVNTDYQTKATKRQIQNTMALGFPQGHAKYLVAGMQKIDAADKVEMHLDKDPSELHTFLMGYAYKTRGNLERVTMGGEDVSLGQSQAIGVSSYKSYSQSMLDDLKDQLQVDIKSPSAAVAMKLMAKAQNGSIADKDILAVQENSEGTFFETVRKVQDMSTRDAAAFQRSSGISSETLRLLNGGQKMKEFEEVSDVQARILNRVAEDMGEISSFAAKNGQTIVGPNEMPDSMRALGKPFLFVSGDADSFKNAENIIGIVGEKLSSDNEKESALASKIAPQISALSDTNVTRAWVENSTPMDMKPQKGDIVFVKGGLGLVENETQSGAQDARDMAGAITVSDQVPFYSVYQPPARSNSKEKGQMIQMLNHGNNRTEQAAGRSLGQISDRLMVTNGKAGNDTVLTSAVEQNLMKGTKVIVVAPGTSKSVSTFTHVLSTQSGLQAMKSAGFGNSTLESKKMANVQGGPIAMKTNTDPKRTASQIESLVMSGVTLDDTNQKTRQKRKEEQR